MGRANFTGEYPLKVDGKGRMSIPASFRRVLEANDPDWTEGLNPRLHILHGPHLKDHLTVYSATSFQRIADGIDNMPLGDPNRDRMSRLILGKSLEMEVDKDGRIVLPLRQRQKLGLTEGEITFMGAGDHFEIWKSATFEQMVDEPLDDWLEEQAEEFNPLSLLAAPQGVEAT